MRTTYRVYEDLESHLGLLYTTFNKAQARRYIKTHPNPFKRKFKLFKVTYEEVK